MGQYISQQEPDLATPIKQLDLQAGVESAIQQYRNDIRKLGFAVIEMNEAFMNECFSYRSLCADWFYENTFEDKLKYEAEIKDEIMKEIGRKPNIGYVLSKKKKRIFKI